MPILIDWWRRSGAPLGRVCALSRRVGKECGDEASKEKAAGEGKSWVGDYFPIVAIMCFKITDSLPPKRLGGHEVFLFPNGLNQRRGYLVGRKLTHGAAFPSDLSKVTRLLSSTLKQ